MIVNALELQFTPLKKSILREKPWLIAHTVEKELKSPTASAFIAANLS
jgi:hypothetical protein